MCDTLCCLGSFSTSCRHNQLLHPPAPHRRSPVLFFSFDCYVLKLLSMHLMSPFRTWTMDGGKTQEVLWS